MLDIKVVTVIGASGTMGCYVSGIFASFGNAKVYMVSRDIEKSKASVIKAAKSVRASFIEKNLIPADYSMLDKCVSESDLIFESTKEDILVKLEVTKSIARNLKKDAIICSGTSGLSITQLSKCLNDEDRKRYFGVHMFNPPYHMTLCELIPTQYSDIALMEKLSIYLKSNLYRVVVSVKDQPAFLANRIGFQFINEAMQYAEKYAHNGGIDYIDAILGGFTGRSMSPLTTADFVGLDVHKAIVDNVYYNTSDYANDTFALPNFCKILIDQGYLGRKVNGGFYKILRFEDGTKQIYVYDIASGKYRKRNQYAFPFAEKMLLDIQEGSYSSAFRTLISDSSEEANIALDFLLKYVLYSLSAVEKVGFDIHAVDDAMATGFNWCPPLAIVDALSSVCDFEELVISRLSKHNQFKDIDIKHLLSLIETSKYDYRIFFRAKR